MMAGTYAVQGAWYPLLAVHLEDEGVGGRMRGAIFASMAIASVISPPILAYLADRRFSIQRLMAAVYGLGASILGLIGLGAFRGDLGLFAAFLGYWIVMAPGLSLGSTLALRNLPSPERQFSRSRMWGTFGWMVVGWFVSGFMAWRGSAVSGRGAHDAFLIAAALSIGVALYCLTLPDTPPIRKAGPGRAGESRWDFDAWGRLLRNGSAQGFLLVAFGVALTSPFVYQVVPGYLEACGLPRSWTSSAMSLGQVLEIVALLALPRVLLRFGDFGTLTLGITAWAAYYGLLAAGLPLALTLPTLMLQGVAIAFFQIVGPMFLDRRAPADLRASAQGLYTATTTGLGSLFGNFLAGESAAWSGPGSSTPFRIALAIDAGMLLIAPRLLRDRRDSPPANRARTGEATPTSASQQPRTHQPSP